MADQGEVFTYSAESTDAAIESADAYLGRLQSIVDSAPSLLNILVGGSTTSFDTYTKINIAQGTLENWLNRFPTALSLGTLFSKMGLKKPTQVDIPVINRTYTDGGLSQELQNKLLSDMQNGGYGIETDDEEGIYNRARDRANEAGGARASEAVNRFASLGLSEPPGALSQNLDFITAEVVKDVGEVNREIFVNRTNLFVQNRQFAMTTSGTVDQYLRNFFIQSLEVLLRELTVKIQNYDSLLRAEVARIQAVESEGRLKITEYQADISKYSAQAPHAANYIDYARHLDDVADANRERDARDKIEKLKVDVQELEVEANYYTQMSQHLGSVYSNLLSATAGAINTLETTTRALSE